MRILLFLLLLVASAAEATHIRSGYITVWQISPGSLTCEITLTMYMNTGSEVSFGGGIIDFGDGQTMTTPTTDSDLRPDLGPNIGQVIFTTTHTYATPGNYLVSYSEPNRVAGIINMSNSVETRFYMEALLDMIDGPPEITFVAPPIFRASLGNNVSTGLGVTNGEGYRFQYFLVSPKKERGVAVQNYLLPAGAHVNPFNGHFTWPLAQVQLVGTYVFALHVDAYDTNDNYVGYFIFDFQIDIEDANVLGKVEVKRPLDPTGRVYTATTDSIKVILEGDRPEWDMTLFTELEPSVVSMVTTDSVANGKYYKVNWIKFNNSNPGIRRYNPYEVVVRASLNSLGSYAQDVTFLFFTEDVTYSYMILAAEPGPQNISVYPNPIENFLHVEGVSDNFQITIYSLNGKTVLAQQAAAGETVDLRDLPRGHYVVRINGAPFRLVKN